MGGGLEEIIILQGYCVKKKKGLHDLPKNATTPLHPLFNVQKQLTEADTVETKSGIRSLLQQSSARACVGW